MSTPAEPRFQAADNFWHEHQAEKWSVGEERHEDVRLDARLALVVDRPQGQVVLDLLERLLDLGELGAEAPKCFGWLRRADVGAQQVAALTGAHTAQPAAIELELEAGRRRGVGGLGHADPDCRRGAAGFLARGPELHQHHRRPGQRPEPSCSKRIVTGRLCMCHGGSTSVALNQ